jgi:hypothetical protein
MTIAATISEHAKPASSTLPPLDRWQFRLHLGRYGAQVPDGAIRSGRVIAEVGEGMPVRRLFDVDGRRVGLLLGFPIDLSGWATPTGDLQLPFPTMRDPDEVAERMLAALAGRFALVLTGEGAAHVYLDAFGQVPVVYDPSLGIAASSAHALFGDDDYEDRFNRATFATLRVAEDGWYPSGLTAHRGLKRLLPNHCLDLATFATHRHWPRKPVAESGNPREVVGEIIRLVQAQLEILSRDEGRRLALALTAGKESRMLLACARHMLPAIDVMTINFAHSRTDMVVAEKICADMGIPHLVLEPVFADQEEEARYVRRNGHCMAGVNARGHPTLRAIADTHHFIGGAGGGVAKPFLLRQNDPVSGEISATDLIHRLGLPATDELVEATAGWIANSRCATLAEMLDLAYIELRMGPWSSAQAYSDPWLVRFAPLGTRRMVELMMSLPASWRMGGRLSDEIVRREWPELGGYPVNSLGFWKDTLTTVRRAINDPHLVIKKLRKRFA